MNKIFKKILPLIVTSLGLQMAGAIGVRHDVEAGRYEQLCRHEGEYDSDDYPEFGAVAVIGVVNRRGDFEVLGTGTLIDKNWILTAAHVVMSSKWRHDFEPGLKVRFGPSAIYDFVERQVQDIAVPLPFSEMKPLRAPGWRYSEKKTVHAEFHDLALLRLDEPVEDIEPIPWGRTKAPLPGRRVFIAGYGEAAPGDDPKRKSWKPAGSKLAAENVIDREVTLNPFTGHNGGGLVIYDFDNGDDERNSLNGKERVWNQIFGEGESSAEALELEGAAYPGDSGGPAIAEIEGEWRVIGVSAYGTGYPPGKRRTTIEYGDILVYTHVPKHADWIQSVVAPGEVETGEAEVEEE